MPESMIPEPSREIQFAPTSQRWYGRRLGLHIWQTFEPTCHATVSGFKDDEIRIWHSPRQSSVNTQKSLSSPRGPIVKACCINSGSHVNQNHSYKSLIPVRQRIRDQEKDHKGDFFDQLRADSKPANEFQRTFSSLSLK